VRFKADLNANKINLDVGAYRTDDGKPYVLNVVRQAEARVAADKSLNKEYLDISGEPKFVQLANKLLFGEDSPAIREKRLVSAQSLSGTGALRVGAEFIKR
jgi:aspartate/tyrosine/aromatic aminotransferase